MKRSGWNRKVGIMVLFACLLATFVACGGEKQKETSVVSDSGSSSHSSESSVASSSEADSSTTESVPMGTSIDKSEYIMNLFGGRVLGNKGSGLVYDLDTDIHAVGQKIFDELKIPVNLKQDYVFPQLTFDTEDAKNFNEFIKMLSNDILGNWEEGQNTYFESIKDDILQNGFGYLKYGVVESEKFLSVIIVHAYTYEDYRRPDYTMSAYVFEKDTGRYVSARELIDMAKAENQDRLYAGLADVFGRFIVDYTSVNQSLAARYATYLYALWDSVQHSAPGFVLNPMSFALGSISDAVLYVDESGIPRIAIPYNDYFFYDSGGRFEAAKKDLEKYTWYNETVVDIPLADLKEEEIRESE
ncbi:MAG: hypothetical protein Q4A41_05085, partial [Bacillota bacterium]|nr:hypothetical protein [Bacillota bacterium]